LRRLYHDLLAARREWPALRDFENRSTRLLPDAQTGPLLELLRGPTPFEGQACILFNLSEQTRPFPGSLIEGRRILFSSESPRYGGERKESHSIEHLLPAECLVMGPASWCAFV